MTRRKQTKHYLKSFPWQLIFKGTVLLAMAGFVHMIPKPVPDTKGVNFLLSTALCSTEEPAHIFIVPQTTEAVNVTIISLVYTIPQGGVLRKEMPCAEIGWGNISTEGVYITATQEVSVYVEYPGESHVVFPIDTLGFDYVVTTLITSEMDETCVIITGNGSNVEITLPTNMTFNLTFQGETYASSEVLNFTLLELETAAISCKCDLTGASIVSSDAVSVFVGSRKSDDNNFIVDQLPPSNIWGRRFIWPGHPSIARNITLKIAGRRSQTTLITITTKDDTVQTHLLSDIPSISMQLQIGDFLSIETNSSVLCAIAYTIYDLSSNGHVTFRFLAPLLLYHVSSTFVIPVDMNSQITVTLILSASSYQYISMNKTAEIAFSKRPMTYIWNYFILRDVSIQSPYTIRTSDTNKAPFYSNVIRRSNNSAYDYPLGMRMTGIYDKCVKAARAHGGNGDGVDNDCDNKIDEEQLNSVDDDGDNAVDEDIVYSGVIQPSAGDMAWAYILKNREEDTGISTSVILVIISIVVSITSVLCLLGGMILADKIRRMVHETRVIPFLENR